MNLGQLLGEQKLAMWRLEDELGERAAAFLIEKPKLTLEAHSLPLERRPMRKGIGNQIRAAMPWDPPGDRIHEIAARLRGVERNTVSSFIGSWPDVRRTGEPGAYRYYLPRST